MNQSKKINRIAINRIADIEWEGSRATTGKTMWADMVPALPFDNFPGLPGNAFGKGAGQTVRDRTIFFRLSVQISFETPAENSFHDARPKTSWKANPSSLFESKSSSRLFNSALISASVRESVFRLSINSLASAARSSCDNDRASSATVKFVIGMGKQYRKLVPMQGFWPGVLGLETALSYSTSLQIRQCRRKSSLPLLPR
jgi:hypothetical protein